MAADKMKEILKHFPDLEDGWKEMEEKLKEEPAEMEMLSLKYRQMVEMEKLKENLPEPEFTKAKRAESANESPKSKFVYPDKLYARTNDNITLDISYAPQTLEAVEYVRTDAFIEKADKFISFFHTDDTELRNYLLKKFHDYMKGE